MEITWLGHSCFAVESQGYRPADSRQRFLYHQRRPSQKAGHGIREQFPDIEHWYLGSHSLGGAMAASYEAGHAGFGRCGAQAGDGTPTIFNDKQIDRTAEEIARTMGLLSQ